MRPLSFGGFCFRLTVLACHHLRPGFRDARIGLDDILRVLAYGLERLFPECLDKGLRFLERVGLYLCSVEPQSLRDSGAK